MANTTFPLSKEFPFSSTVCNCEAVQCLATKWTISLWSLGSVVQHIQHDLYKKPLMNQVSLQQMNWSCVHINDVMNSWLYIITWEYSGNIRGKLRIKYMFIQKCESHTNGMTPVVASHQSIRKVVPSIWISHLQIYCIGIIEFLRISGGKNWQFFQPIGLKPEIHYMYKVWNGVPKPPSHIILVASHAKV